MGSGVNASGGPKFASAVWKVVDFIVLYLEKKKKPKQKQKKNRLSRKNLKK